MKQIKIVLLAVIVIAVALLAFGGWRMMRNLSRAHAAEASRDAARARLQQLYQAKLFPSAPNAEVVRQDGETLKTMLAELAAAMKAGQVEPEDLSPALFIQALQSSVRELQRKAPIVEGARIVSDGFAFGFERYLAVGSSMPSQTDVRQLTQQLRMVERLCDEVYAAQVTTLRAVRREDFEAGAAPAEADTGRGRGRGRGPASGTPAAAARDRSDLYTSQHFTLELALRKPALADLMNRFAAMDMFVVVREISLRKQSEDLKAPPTPAAVPAAAPAAPETPAAAPAAPSAEGLPAAQRLVSGVEIDPVIDIRIELDVYNFNIAGV